MKTPLVIGYRGDVGKYILNSLLDFMPKACDILCYDINETEDHRIIRFHQADVIFLCVPFNKTLEFFEKYKNRLRGKIVVEQTSLKSWIHGVKQKLKEDGIDCTILSMHLLFRPSATPNLADQQVSVVTGSNWREVSDFIVHQFADRTIWFKSIEKHDETMARQQALVHRVLLSLDECLKKEVPNTYISRRVRELAERIYKGDKELYAAIQENPSLKKEISLFNKNMKSFKVEKYFPRPVANKTNQAVPVQRVK